MKILSLNTILILLSFFMVFNIQIAVASDEPDIFKEIDPTYEHVDVILETEWGENEKFEDVNVYINKKNNKVKSVIVFQEEHKTEIYILPDIIIKINNHYTKKLIEKYQLSK